MPALPRRCNEQRRKARSNALAIISALQSARLCNLDEGTRLDTKGS
jgi:hypothetical protein